MTARVTELWLRVDAPAAADIVSARNAAGLTQALAGALLGIKQSRWAEYERGVRNMPAAKWSIFLLLCDLHPRLSLRPR